MWGLSSRYSYYLWKIETFIEEDTRNTVVRTMTPQSPAKKALWDLPQFSQSPSAALSYFPESHGWSEISSLSILVLGKARSHRVPNLGCSGADSPGWFDVLPKNSAGDLMHEQLRYHDEAANHQSAITVAFWIIWIVSMEECSSLTQIFTDSLLFSNANGTYAHSTASTAPTV